MKLLTSNQELTQAIDTCKQLLNGKKVVVVCGDRLSLTSLCTSSPIIGSVVGGATTESEGLQLISQFQPDLLITTDNLESGYGLSLIRSAKQNHPDLKVLTFLQRESTDVVQEAMDGGADGVMFISSLGTGHGDFVQALVTTSKGGVYYPKQVRELVATKVRPSLPDPLSQRELDVVRCIIQGMKNQEIADELFVSLETVKSHVKTTIQKLGVRDRTQAAVYALTYGLVVM